MIRHEPLTPLADARRAMPESATERLEAARDALDALRRERRRLGRIGLERPLVRCEAEIRYWTFVSGLLALPPRPEPGAAAIPGGVSWPSER